MSSSDILCTMCNEVFQSRNKLFKHVASSHGRAPVVDNELPHKKPKVDSRTLEEQIIIVEEDSDYRVICKPQGMATMGAAGPTLMSSDYMLLPDALKYNISYKKAVPCHRLDRDTGGLVVCSKNWPSEKGMKTFFRAKCVYKKYLAIVAGRLEPSSGFITTPIGGKKSITRYNVVVYSKSSQHADSTISTVELFPITGRKHQLRRHLQSVGHSILGDKRYSYSLTWPPEQFPFMFLFAVGIELPHPCELDRVLSLSGGIVADNASSEVYNSEDEDDEGDDVMEDTEDRGYGRPRADFTASGIKMIRVEIPEPVYYKEYRMFCEEHFREK